MSKSVLSQSIASAVEGHLELPEPVTVFAGPDNVRTLPERQNAKGKVIPAAFSVTASTEDGATVFLNVSANSATSFAAVSRATATPSQLRFTLAAGVTGDVAEIELESGEVLQTPRFRLQYGDFRLASKPVEIPVEEEW